MKAMCNTCQNKGKTRGLSQESYCCGCLHSHGYLGDYYEPMLVKSANEVPLKLTGEARIRQLETAWERDQAVIGDLLSKIHRLEGTINQLRQRLAQQDKGKLSSTKGDNNEHS